MRNKVLFCATVDFHFSAFHLPMLEWFKQQNWEVHIAAKGNMELPFVDKKFNIPIERSPIRLQNAAAYRELRNIIREHDYRIIHCHTPMGGVLARLAARQARRQGTKVIYTAHGFHFCKGAPLANWGLYYPVERLLAGSTDCLITINEEDYGRAVGHRFKAGRIARVHGVGIDTSRFSPVSKKARDQLRIGTPYGPDDLLLFYAAEFNRNKNQQVLVRALAAIKDEAPHVKLLLAGKGALLEECRSLAASLGVADRVQFLGYRNDIVELLPMCDIAVSSSLREGLPVNVMEAMACGLPIVASRNRGHQELVVDGVNGYIGEPLDAAWFAQRLLVLSGSEQLRERMGQASMQAMERYSLDRVKRELADLYSGYMAGE